MCNMIRSFLYALFLLSVSSYGADNSTMSPMGKVCGSTSDCPEGSTCVAGDAVQSIQTCVQNPVCGGNSAGNCPGYVSSGQLICVWDAGSNNKGLYKCMSLERCDAKSGNAACSQACGVNGLPCNGRGSCQASSPGGSFGCTCNTGWTGTFCDIVVNSKCQEGVGNCGSDGECVKGACSCKNDFAGEQCQIAPPNATSVVPSPSKTPAGSTNPDSSKNGNNSNAQVNSSSGSSTTVIVISILAALIVVGIIIFVIYARKKKRDAENSAIGIVGQQSMGENEGATTPKGDIQVL